MSQKDLSIGRTNSRANSNDRKILVPLVEEKQGVQGLVDWSFSDYSVVFLSEVKEVGAGRCYGLW